MTVRRSASRIIATALVFAGTMPLLPLPTLAADAPTFAPRYELPKAQDQSSSASKGSPLRFANVIPLTLSPSNQGKWSAWDEHNDRWTIELFSPGAASISLHFDQFALTQGTVLRLYTSEEPSKALTLNTFNNPSQGAYWSPQFAGNSLIVDLVLPRKYGKRTQLNLAGANIAW